MAALRQSREFLRKPASPSTITRRAGMARRLLTWTAHAATRSPLFAAFVIGMLAFASSCGSGTLDPGTGSAGASGGGGAGGAQACGPVCDIYCAYGNVLDANGCPTCSCKPDQGCLLIQPDCGRSTAPTASPPTRTAVRAAECAAAPICDGVAPENCTESLRPVCECDAGRACAENECGGPPPPVQPAPCPDGSVPPFECVRNDNRRTCGWRVRAVPASARRLGLTP